MTDYQIQGLVDVVDLLRQPFDQASYEAGYRSGYRDGWVTCLDALARTLPSQAYEMAFRFWENELRAWKFHQPGTGHLPPDFLFQQAEQPLRHTIPPGIRFLVLQRDRFRCQLCGVSAEDGAHIRLEVDHKIARSQGGPDTQDNLWTLCRNCNRGKGAKPL